ncbi:MAG: 4-hydroxy-tetrahydrodipicolinate synthase [Acidimicrobiales bacterium]
MTTNSRTDLTGLWIPIVTPFSSDGALDHVSLQRLAEGLLADGADGIVALGTTGEAATLTLEERREVVSICDAACRNAGRPLMVGVGTNSTQTTVHELTQLMSVGEVAAALVVVPYYTRPSEEAVVEHFGLVADASPVPVVLYNVPYRTGRGLGAAALLEAARHPNIAGLKQAVGAVDVVTLEVLAGSGAEFAVLAGDDAFIAPMMALGAQGAIAAAAHACTRLFAQLVAQAPGGNETVGSPGVRALAQALLPVVTAGFAEPNPAVWKGWLAAEGTIESPTLRRPMTEASPASVARLTAAIGEALTWADSTAALCSPGPVGPLSPP